MLEGSVPEFVTPIMSQPSPLPASSAPTHNGFCGGAVRVVSRKALPPTPSLPQQQASKQNATCRRPNNNARRTSGFTGTTSLKTTAIPTPLPPDVTSRLKASVGEQRPRFCDRLSAMCKTGINDCDDDPYAFVDSSTASEVNLHRPLQQTMRNNGSLNRKSTLLVVDEVKSKKKKVTNNIQQTIPKNIILSPQNPVKSKPPQNIVQIQQQQHQSVDAQNLIKFQQNSIIKIQQQQQQLIKQKQELSTSTSKLKTASIPNTSLLRKDQNKKVINNVNSSPPINVAVMPNTKPITTEEDKTTMNQLQAKIARNRVIGKHHRNNNMVNNTSSQIAPAPSIVTPQQILKLKEKSLLEEQLILGVKQEKLNSSIIQQHPQQLKAPQQLKTVTKHFTFPIKSAGSVVTYKKVMPSLLAPQDIKNIPQKSSAIIHHKDGKQQQIFVKNEALSEHAEQLQKFKKFREDEVLYRKDLLNNDFGEADVMEKDVSSYQRHWFYEDVPQEFNTSESREARLSSLKSTLRRRYIQIRNALKTHNTSQGEEKCMTSMQALVTAARTQPNRTAALIDGPITSGSLYVSPRSRNKQRHSFIIRRELVKQDKCCLADCSSVALPLARHCLRHIMYNVDQLLFQHCTAKFADNTQCCIPVFDVQHELPLCVEHAKKKDNYSKLIADGGKPKRSRKKSKPAAMTRPAKRGKKKRNTPNPPPITPTPPPPVVLNHQQQQQPMMPMNIEPVVTAQHPVVLPQTLTSHIQSPPDVVEAQGIVPMYVPTEDSLSQPSHDVYVNHVNDDESEMAGLLRQVEAQALSPGEDLGLMEEADLPLEGAEEELATLRLEGADELAQQATRLLEEHDDLDSVFSQIPADTLNELLNGEKTAAYEPTKQETEALDRALREVEQDVRSLQKECQANVLPAELMESILSGNLHDHLDDTLASLSRHPGAKEEVIMDHSHLMGTSQHLIGVHDGAYQIHSGDLHSQLLPADTHDALIQLDAAVYPRGSMTMPDLGQSLSGTNYMLPQQQQASYPPNDVSALLHPSLLHQSLGSDPTQQLMLTPAAVYGGGAAPPPTPNALHQPAVANTPPFHHHNGFLQTHTQFDAKYTLPPSNSQIHKDS